MTDKIHARRSFVPRMRARIMKPLTGSPKQIAWAESIRNKHWKGLEDFAAMWVLNPKKLPFAVVAAGESAIREYMDRSNAADWINERTADQAQQGLFAAIVENIKYRTIEIKDPIVAMTDDLSQYMRDHYLDWLVHPVYQHPESQKEFLERWGTDDMNELFPEGLDVDGTPIDLDESPL